MPSVYFLTVLCVLFAFVPGYSFYRSLSFSQNAPAYRDLPDYFEKITPALYPEFVGDQLTASISAEGVFVIDVDSAVPIYQKNANDQLYPASTTKMMTALVAVESYGLDEIVEVPEATYSGSMMKLFPGEKISVENLLNGLLINSGNDAAEVLAAYYPGGRDQFMLRMNERALELGLKSTNFVNPSGLPDPNHVSSAWDLGQLAAVVMRNEDLKSIVKVREKTVYGTKGEKHILRTTNQLLGTIPGLDGVKTGYTEEAGEVLVSSVTRKGHRVVIVLLKSNDRFGETKKIVDWVFGNHEWKKY
jgi:D-alanyl-D-alanine carboxypeptidase (penicillin-binding protein 5/6)